MKFSVDFEGWIEVESQNDEHAFTRVFNILNDALSPLRDRGIVIEWEVTTVEQE